MEPPKVQLFFIVALIILVGLTFSNVAQNEQ